MKFTTLIFTLLLSVYCLSQNGKIIEKQQIEIKDLPLWPQISENDTLKTEFHFFNDLNLFSILYWSDSLKVKGVYLEPKIGEKYPVVIFNRGGNRTFNSLSPSMMLMINGKLAAAGYIIIGSNYRFEDQFGGEEINDVLHLFNTINEIEKADTSRVGMFGWSRGGMMTYLSLKKTCRIKTAVIGNGPVDLFANKEFRPEMESNVYAQCIPFYWERKEEELTKRSVLFWPDSLCKTSSLLILSGTEDQRVNSDNTKLLSKKLKKIKYDFKLKRYKTDHFFSNKKDVLYNEVIQWFNTHLTN